MDVKTLSILFIISVFSCKHHAQNLKPVKALSSTPDLPLNFPPDSVKYLRELIDPAMQKKLQTEINKNPKWKRLISQKKMAIGVVDLSDPYNVKYARLNGNVMMYAASLPKIAILLATMDAIFAIKQLTKSSKLTNK